MGPDLLSGSHWRSAQLTLCSQLRGLCAPKRPDGANGLMGLPTVPLQPACLWQMLRLAAPRNGGGMAESHGQCPMAMGRNRDTLCMPALLSKPSVSSAQHLPLCSFWNRLSASPHLPGPGWHKAHSPGGRNRASESSDLTFFEPNRVKPSTLSPSFFSSKVPLSWVTGKKTKG